MCHLVEEHVHTERVAGHGKALEVGMAHGFFLEGGLGLTVAEGIVTHLERAAVDGFLCAGLPISLILDSRVVAFEDGVY